MLRLLTTVTMAAAIMTAAMPRPAAADNDVVPQASQAPSSADIDTADSRSQDAIQQARAVAGETQFNHALQSDGARALSAARKASHHAPPCFTAQGLSRLNGRTQSKAQADIRALLANPRLARPSLTGSNPDNPPPLIFISFSMPEDSLRALVAQASVTGSPLVLRGLVKGSMKRTLAHLRALLGTKRHALTVNTGPSVAIDPTLFERFAVDKVPTFVLPASAVRPCTPQACAVPNHLTVAGDVSLAYALGVMARDAHGTALGRRAERWRRRLEPPL